MANRFKDSNTVKRVPPGGSRPVEAQKEPEVEEATPVVHPVAPSNGLADMIEKKQEGKSCGFYLTTEAIKKLDKAASQLKCSKSKALDLLIKKYL